MAEHPWCKDVARDESVRAAEDAVERPAVPEWREIPERVAALEREVAAMRVPVVPAAEADAEVERLRAERDAAIRERDAALARVAEFEEQAKLAPAPNVGGGSNQADAEPVAWAVVYPHGADGVISLRKADAEHIAAEGDEVVPLYRAPPQPRVLCQADIVRDQAVVIDAGGHGAVCLASGGGPLGREMADGKDRQQGAGSGRDRKSVV